MNKLICRNRPSFWNRRIANCHVFTKIRQQYFPLGEDMFPQLLADLRNAKEFIMQGDFSVRIPPIHGAGTDGFNQIREAINKTAEALYL